MTACEGCRRPPDEAKADSVKTAKAAADDLKKVQAKLPPIALLQ